MTRQARSKPKEVEDENDGISAPVYRYQTLCSKEYISFKVITNPVTLGNFTKNPSAKLATITG